MGGGEALARGGADSPCAPALEPITCAQQASRDSPGRTANGGFSVGLGAGDGPRRHERVAPGYLSFSRTLQTRPCALPFRGLEKDLSNPAFFSRGSTLLPPPPPRTSSLKLQLFLHWPVLLLRSLPSPRRARLWRRGGRGRHRALFLVRFWATGSIGPFPFRPGHLGSFERAGRGQESRGEAPGVPFSFSARLSRLLCSLILTAMQPDTALSRKGTGYENNFVPQRLSARDLSSAGTESSESGAAGGASRSREPAETAPSGRHRSKIC